MPKPVLETRYCGSLKMEIACHGNFGPDPDLHTYWVKAQLGKAPLHVEGHVEVNIGDSNPVGKDAFIKACNTFIDRLNTRCEELQTIQVEMDSEVLKIQLFNITCQNVEGILQPDQPKWLITDREI